MKASKRLLSIILSLLLVISVVPFAAMTAFADEGINVAEMATPSGRGTASHNRIEALNDGKLFDGNQASVWGTWPTTSGLYVELTWDSPVTISSMGVRWYADQASGSSLGGVQAPIGTTLTYYNGESMVEVPNYSGIAYDVNVNSASSPLNMATFDEITTTRLRLSLTCNPASAGTGIQEWEVYSNDIQSIVDAVAGSFSIPGSDSIISPSITLPTENTAGYNVVWTSDNTDVISIDGNIATITRPAQGEEDATVTLTVTVDNGAGVTSSKDIVCTVRAEGYADATLDLDVSQAYQAIPETLYGVFFEDINHALDGGINAELIENGSFEAHGMNNGRFSFSNNVNTLDNWSKIAKDGASGSAQIDLENPMNENNTKCAVITIEDAGTGLGYGIANNGFGTNTYNNTRASMPINGGITYNFDGYLKGEYDGTIRVFLETNDGVLNSNIVEIPAITADWTKYTGSLTALESVDSRLAIIGDAAGTFYVDFWNLHPEDSEMWHDGAAGGLNKELMTAMENLHPKFLRFPGGCASEGIGTRERMYNWKNTVGPREERVQMAGYWDYLMSFDIGYYEYMLMCEELGAEAVPVLNAGLSCQFRSPIYTADLVTEMPEFIDDALDFIEFCNGDVTTEWGALRAEMGHPEPFNLKYISLGNENWGDVYWDRFALMYEAVKEEYPEIIVITTAGPYANGSDYDRAWQEVNEKYTDTIVDEHYYTTSQWMLDSTNRYDNTSIYKNNGAKVFIGEYAANKDPGNTHNSALCEAIYMTSIERNSDTIEMASYAPFMCKADVTNGTRWLESDLIWFTGRTTALTANYYVQQLFATNVGDKLIKSEAASDKLTAYSASVDTSTGEVYVKYVNRNDYPLSITVNAVNLPAVTQRDAVISTLTSDNLYGINTVTDLNQTPAPTTEVIENCGDSVTITVPKYSVTAVKFTSDEHTEIITPANMTGIKGAVNSAKAYEPDDYTEKSYNALQEAISAAEAIIAKEAELTSADQDMIDAAANDVTKAVTNLVLKFVLQANEKSYATGETVEFTVKTDDSVEEIIVTCNDEPVEVTSTYKDARGQRTFTVSFPAPQELGSLTYTVSNGTYSDTFTITVVNSSLRPEELKGNVALKATVDTTYCTTWNSEAAINDGKQSDPTITYRQASEGDAWGTWPEEGPHTVTYTWENPVKIDGIDILWHCDVDYGGSGGVQPPESATLYYKDADGELVEVPNCSLIGNSNAKAGSGNGFNYAQFDEITTTELQLVIEPAPGAAAVGIVEWIVYGAEIATRPEVLKDNVALDASVDTSYCTTWNSEAAINDGKQSDPTTTYRQVAENDAWGTWPEKGPHTVTYTWDTPVKVDSIDILWHCDGNYGSSAGVEPPESATLYYRNADGELVPVPNCTLIDRANAKAGSGNGFNYAKFDEVETTELQLVIEASPTASAVGIVEWIVYGETSKPAATKADLLAAITEANNVDTTDWSETEINNLVAAVNEGLMVYVNPNATPTEIANAIDAIYAAINVQPVTKSVEVISVNDVTEDAIAIINTPIKVVVKTDALVKDLTVDNEFDLNMGTTVADVVTNDDGTLTWTLYISAATKGDRTFTILADYGNGFEETSATFNIKVFEQYFNIISVDGKTENYTVKANDNFEVVILTEANVESLTFLNEYDALMGVSVIDVKENVNGTKLWTLNMSIGTKGDRVFGIYAAVGDSVDKVADLPIKVVASDAYIADENVQADIISVSSQKTAVVNTNFKVEVKTSKGVSALAFANESGKDIGKALISQTEDGDQVIWVFETQFGSKGNNRKITVKAKDANGNWIEDTAELTVSIIAQ